MSNLIVKDANGDEKYIKKLGTGTSADPFVEPAQSVSLSTDGKIDAFGRLRVSEVTTQFDSKQLHDKLPLFWDEETSGGAETSAHSTTNAQTVMTTSNSGEYVIRQTFQSFNYQSGKSQQIFMTFGAFNTETNITKRVGYFSSNTVAPFDTNKDGLWLENDGTGVYIKVSRTGTETFSVAQASWDDPMDGSGESGVTLDWTKTQILMIDFEWLGVGITRFSFVVDGMIYPVLVTKNANVKDLVYMSSPNQPLRYEIRQSGVGSGTFNHICSTVGSEGSLNKLGRLFTINNNGTSVSLASTGTKYPILGIKLQSAKADTLVDIVDIEILETAGKNCLWELHFNPTLSAGLTYGNLANSSMQTAVGDGVITVSSDGTVFASGYVTGKTDASKTIENALRLGMSIAGTVDEICLVMEPLAINGVAYGSLSWRELI